MNLQGVDASYTTLDDAAAKRLKAAGVTVFAQALWTGAEQPAPRVTNLRVAQANGFILLGYISVTGNVAGQYHAKMGRQGVPQDLWDALALAPIDVELDGIPNSTIRGALDAVYALGKRPCVYTSESCWLEKQGDSHDFGDTLLWDARWTGIPGPHPVTYGKWAGVVGYQYTGGQNVEGVYVDRDTFIKELLVPKEETMPTLEDLQGEITELRAKVQADNTLQTQLIQAWAAFHFAPLSHVADKTLHVNSKRLQQMDELYERLNVK